MSCNSLAVAFKQDRRYDMTLYYITTVNLTATHLTSVSFRRKKNNNTRIVLICEEPDSVENNEREKPNYMSLPHSVTSDLKRNQRTAAIWRRHSKQ